MTTNLINDRLYGIGGVEDKIEEASSELDE
jgi:hypothetical protein